MITYLIILLVSLFNFLVFQFFVFRLIVKIFNGCCCGYGMTCIHPTSTQKDTRYSTKGYVLPRFPVFLTN